MVNINGNLIEASKASISVNNRGLLFGDAIVDTLRLSNNKILFWEDHYFRLMATMRMMRMEIPSNFNMEYLEKQILNTINAQLEKSNTFSVNFIIHRIPKDNSSDKEVAFIIRCTPLQSEFYLFNDSDYEVELYKDHVVSSDVFSTLITNNKAIQVLGNYFAEENGYQNCILLNEKKEVVQALTGNIFLVTGNIIKTPPIESGCLNGILRKQLINICAVLPEYVIEEATVSTFELQKADELFITNSNEGIRSITKYRKKLFNTVVAKDLLSKLNTKIRLS